jgi:hypothetical protein
MVLVKATGPVINSLSVRQEEELRHYRDRWNEIGRSTDPVDKAATEKCIRLAYKQAKLTPVPVIWCSSPVAIEIVKTAQTDKSLGVKTDWSLLNRRLDQEFGFESSERIVQGALKSIELCGSNRVGNTVIPEIWLNAWEWTGTNIRKMISKSCRAHAVQVGQGLNIWSQIINSLFTGNIDTTQWWRKAKLAPSISRAGYPLPHFITYEFYREVLGLEQETNLIKPLLDLMKVGSYFAPFRGICFASERPLRIGTDERQRLHSETQAALEFADGVKTYAIHEVAVNRKIIEEWDKITGKDIDKEQNVEVRRVLIERYGFARYILETGATLVQEDRYGQLYKKQRNSWQEPVVMVKVRNSTPEPDGSIKDYYLRVRWDTETAHQGVASTFGLTAEEYNPIVET